MMIIIDF